MIPTYEALYAAFNATADIYDGQAAQLRRRDHEQSAQIASKRAEALRLLSQGDTDTLDFIRHHLSKAACEQPDPAPPAGYGVHGFDTPTGKLWSVVQGLNKRAPDYYGARSDACRAAEIHQASGVWPMANDLALRQSRPLLSPELTRETTVHGYRILQRKPSTVKGSAVVVAHRIEVAYAFEPFVVWRMDANGVCEGGTYCATLEDAARHFAERT